MKKIVVLHGWGSRALNWKSTKTLLEQKGFEVFIPDLPGFGEHPGLDRAWSITDYIEWVKKWSEEQSLVNFCLVGHSFGGGIAAVFAAKYPEKIIKLILVAPAIRRRKTIKKYLFLLISKIGKAIFSFSPLSYFYPLFQKILYKIIGVSDYLAATLRSPMAKETFQKIISEDLSSHLSHISTPTLLIWGDKDMATPLSDAYFIKGKLQNADLKIIQGVRHRLNVECPEKLAEIISGFLNPKP